MHRDPRSRTATDPKSHLHLQSNPYQKNTKAPEYGAFDVSTQHFVAAR
jgi:hypothetical protein